MHRYDAKYVDKLAARTFGNPEDAHAWLDRPSVQLGGRSPRQLLATAAGVRRVVDLLTQIDDDKRLHRDHAGDRR